jgi:protein-disulfide isomerase
MAYCVADENKDAFRRFHAALYAQQPSETASTFPDNAKLLEVARQSGVGVGPNDPVGKCVNNGTYLDMVNALVANTKIQGTPTIKINGQEVGNDLMGGATKPDPQLLVDKIKAIAGDVPGLGTAPPAMRPGGAPGAPQPPAVPAPPAAPAPEAPAQP